MLQRDGEAETAAAYSFVGKACTREAHLP